MMSLSLVAVLLGLLAVSHGYKPIIAMHGISFNSGVGTSHDWDDIKVNIDNFILRIHSQTCHVSPMLVQPPQ